MRIGLDVMGGDFAPGNCLDGAVLALEGIDKGDEIALFGDEELIKIELTKRGVSSDNFIIVHAPEIITMEDKPLKSIQEKPASGISLGLKMLACGELDGFASAGNSGAVLAGAILNVRCIGGIIRPCTATTITQEDGKISLLLDIGTTPDARPDVLDQFGVIGSVYAETFLEIKKPRVALINVGAEDGKGNLQCQAAFSIMSESESYDFIGNMEPRDFFKSKADVFVTDGFVGNIIIKQIETFYRLLQKRNITDGFIATMNYELYGGSPILGVNAPVVLGHGISSALAIKNMILQAKRMCDYNVVQTLKQVFQKN